MAAVTKPSSVIPALVHLSRGSSGESSDSCAYANVVARSLGQVSHSHSVPVTKDELDKMKQALAQVAELVQQQILFASESEHVYTAVERRVMREGVAMLWMRVTTHQLHVALMDLVHTIEFMPRAIAFWKMLRKRQVRAAIQRGPFEWFLPSSVRVTKSERLYSLEQTMNTHLTKIGLLKKLLTKCQQKENEMMDLPEMMQLVRESMGLLEYTYSTKGIVPPRKGKGAFKTMEALPFKVIHFERDDVVWKHELTNANDVLGSLHRLEQHLETVTQAQQQFSCCFDIAMAPCRPPSKLRQRWLHLTIAALCVTTGGVWVLKNQKEFQAAAATIRGAVNEFMSEHLIEPIQAIIGEVILNQKPEIQDASALLDTKQSLRRMLADFVKDTNPNIPAPEMDRIMNEMDMSVVSLQYEKQLSSAVRNLMTGDIVRMLLIQVQFIKKELMVAMGAIDELMYANQLNLQMLATIPTFILFGGAYTLARELFHQIYKRTSEKLFYDPSEIAAFMRNSLRDIERLLNKQNGVKDHVLGPRDLGLLLLLLHQLRDLFETHHAFFEEYEQERFEEDLNDLIEEGLLVSQQLAVIQRMYHTHPFLQSSRFTARSLLQ